jgi:hypothetical protein
LVLSAIFKSESIRPLPPRIFDPEQRLVTLGDLIYTVSFAAQTAPGGGKKAFEVGQVLTFDDVAAEPTPELGIPDVIDFQQNTNYLDLADIGLTDDEIKEFYKSARGSFNESISTINALVTEIRNLRIELQSIQASINEANKALDAAVVTAGTATQNRDFGDTIVGRIGIRLTQLKSNHVKTSIQINTNILKVRAEYKKLLKVREVVR